MSTRKTVLPFFSLFLAVFLLVPAIAGETGVSAEKTPPLSDHFDGLRYFNPGVPQPSPAPPGQTPGRGLSGWFWRWMLSDDWPEAQDNAPGPRPAARVPKGAISVTPVGHATFLIQMDGINILTDPIWSDRCSPVSWAGPKRHLHPGIRFEDLPPIDVVLVSHNHYDHLDLPSLERLAAKGTPRAIMPLGNRELVREAGIPTADELDWWQSVRVSPEVAITLVPAQHFSMRTLWNRNKTLWGGFVISGRAGNVYYAGDTGYGAHFREIARRFSPLRVALLPIAPFRPEKAKANSPGYPLLHMGPAEAVRAHLDLGKPFTIAAHFQVFRLGNEGYADAVTVLASALKGHDLEPGSFIAPAPGQAVSLPHRPEASPALASRFIAPERGLAASARP